MKQTVPSFLQPGDTIGIGATARFATAESLAIAERTITAEGFNCYYSPEISMQHHQLAGTVAERVQHFNALIHNPNIKAIWNIRGGYGSAEIVD